MVKKNMDQLVVDGNVDLSLVNDSIGSMGRWWSKVNMAN